MAKKEKRATGTREWAQSTVNCVLGCSHDCLYCYARYTMVERFKKVRRGQWARMRVRKDEVEKSRGKRSGVIMFPSTHDITPETYNPCMTVLTKLLESGNTVLVVSKPHFDVIEGMTLHLKDYKENLMFRFTIGSPRDDVLKFWEPGAPSFGERRNCLQIAFERGFKTSVSAEPLLDPDNVTSLWSQLIPFVNWEFWIGKLNRPERRIDMSDAKVRERLIPILEGQTDERVMEIVRTFEKEPLVRWKDSYKEVIERCR